MGTRRYAYASRRTKRWKRQMMVMVLSVVTAATAYWLGSTLDRFDQSASGIHFQGQLISLWQEGSLTTGR